MDQDDTWIDPGYTCITKTGASCDDDIVQSGGIDTSKTGKYHIDYIYNDTILATRTIHVESPSMTVKSHSGKARISVI